MHYDAFISYSSKDKAIADQICQELEADGLRCCIAPRNISPGATWGEAIVEAIENSSAMVLVFSQSSNDSPQVVREIERAVNKNLRIIPIRVHDVKPSKQLEYFISSCHWLDASSGPLSRYIPILAAAIRGVPIAPLSPRLTRRKALALCVGVAILLASASILIFNAWFLKGNRSDSSVILTSPPHESNTAGPILIGWSADQLDPTNLSYEVIFAPEGKAPVVVNTGRLSIVLPEGLEGSIRWKVRPIWQLPNGKQKEGPWSKEQQFTWYQNALRRFLVTRRLQVGIAEPDVIFIRKENDGFGGLEVELLRKVAKDILAKHNVAGEPQISWTTKVWGDGLFQLLEKDGSVDLIASGISITQEREKKYGLTFTKPTFSYPQSFIVKLGTPVFANGKVLLERIGVVANSTNETLIRQLVPEATSDRVKLYRGSGSYEVMLGDLAAERLDGVLIDKPYAKQKIEAFTRSQGVQWELRDVTAAEVPGVIPERIGFAFRKTDRALLQEVNASLPETPQEPW